MIAEKLSTEEKQQALDLACRSQAFARSDRLRGLLQYVCRAEMAGRQDSLNEYVIGVEALGRREGYSPSEDSCVRSRIYELRQRLERFYATEAPDAPLRIDLPKGSYIPRYVPRAAQPLVQPAEPHVPADVVHENDPPQRRIRQVSVLQRYWGLIAAFAAGAIVMYSVAGIRERSRTPKAAAPWTAELESIWRPFLDPATPVLVSFQSRLFLSTGGTLVLRDAAIDSFAAVESSEQIMRTKELFGIPQLYENRNYTDFGAASACLILGKFLGPRQPAMFAKRSSDVNWDDLGKHNVIVLGKPSADPDIARLLPKEHFVIEGANLRNLRPRPGEPAQWTDSGKPWDHSNNWSQKYGLVTMIPGTHPGRWILSLAGSGSEHLWALAQFLTDADSAKQLAARLGKSASDFPSSWQAIVRADFKAQSPVKVEYVAHRKLDITATR